MTRTDEGSQCPIARALHIHATNGLIRDWRPTTAGGWTVDPNGSDPIELHTAAAAHLFITALDSAALAAPPVVEVVASHHADGGNEFATFIDGELVPREDHRRARVVLVDTTPAGDAAAAWTAEQIEALSPAARSAVASAHAPAPTP